MLTDVGFFSHAAAAIGFGSLALVLLLRRQETGSSGWLIAAALTTMVWALLIVVAARLGGIWLHLVSPAETLRTAMWIVFMVSVLRRGWRLDERLRSSFTVAGMIGFVVGIQLVLDLALAVGTLPEAGVAAIASVLLISRMMVAIAGLVLIHNLFVNADPESQGEVRLLCIGLGGIFAYDLNLYTFEFLFRGDSLDLFNIRGAVDVIVVPLLLLASNQNWASRISVSRQVAFHTLSFSMIGFYLIVMAFAAYGLRLVGGDWGRLLQISFLFATVLAAIIIFVAPRFRARLRLLIAKNFFTYKYDYRQEWLRFIATVSGADAGLGGLSERVIRGVCAVVDAPGGILYARDADGNLGIAASWRFDGFSGTTVQHDDALAGFLAGRARIVDFDELRAGTGDYGALRLPAWAAGDARVWLAVPLLHLDRLIGFLLLERTLVSRALNWEDFDLLRTLGRQAASYIAEAASQEALDEAGKFDEFNRRFAFIMHDLKNLVSQLSLVSRNAERHADNPAFRADMAATLKSSVGKMNDMLARLSQREIIKSEIDTIVNIDQLVGEIVISKQRSYPALEIASSGRVQPVAGDAMQIEQMFAHLIQNAIDASPNVTPVRVQLAGDGKNIVVEIVDSGTGMTPAFLRNDLFRPFHSTKPGGFGIGAYEAREIARAMGGQLDVESRPGNGTTFTVRLPLHIDTREDARA